MANVAEMLDEAIRLGQNELGCLEKGDVDRAEQFAGDRAELTENAMAQSASDDLDVLFEKLSQLKNLHGRITGEAERLRERLKADMQRIRREGKRHKGYGGAVRGVSMVRNRFLNKTG